MKVERGEVRIRISQLSTGIHEYHFDAEAADIGLDNGFREIVKIDATLDKSNRQLYLTAKVNTSANFECDRCLDPFKKSLVSVYHVFYVYDELDTAKYEADEVRVIHADSPYIELADDIRETILLSVPLKLLCGDDCKGLCPHCGINWNRQTCACNGNAGDSRWEDLERLLHD